MTEPVKVSNSDNGAMLSPSPPMIEVASGGFVDLLNPDPLRSVVEQRGPLNGLRIEASNLTTTGGAHWRWPGALPNGGRLPDSVKWFGGLDPDAAMDLWLATETLGWD